MTLQVGWDISYNGSKPFITTMSSLKWSSLGFNNSEKIHIRKNKRGVYIIAMSSKNFFCDTNPFNMFETPVYVGMSTDLRKRFHSHTAGTSEEALWKRIPFERRKNCTFWFAIFEDRTPKDILKEVEQQLLNAFGCPLNKINSVTQGKTIQGKI